MIVHHYAHSVGVTAAENSGNAVTNPPRFLIVTDYDDSVVPSSLDSLRQYSTCISRPVTSDFSYTIKPAVSVMAYEGVSATGYSPKWDQWISTNDPSVPHYGLKWGIGQTPITGGTGQYGFTREVEFHLEFKNSK